MNRIPITEAAKLAGITREQARYWSRLLDLEMIKDGRISYLAAGSENMLLAMAESVKSGQAPSVAASEIKNTFAAPAIVPEQPENNTAIIARLNDLESAVLLLVQSNQTLSAENKKLSEHNSALLDLIQLQNRKLDKITARLPAPPEPAPIQKIQKAAVVKVPLLKRLWLELFDPIQLRATS